LTEAPEFPENATTEVTEAICLVVQLVVAQKSRNLVIKHILSTCTACNAGNVITIARGILSEQINIAKIINSFTV